VFVIVISSLTLASSLPDSSITVGGAVGVGLVAVAPRNVTAAFPPRTGPMVRSRNMLHGPARFEQKDRLETCQFTPG